MSFYTPAETPKALYENLNSATTILPVDVRGGAASASGTRVVPVDVKNAYDANATSTPTVVNDGGDKSEFAHVVPGGVQAEDGHEKSAIDAIKDAQAEQSKSEAAEAEPKPNQTTPAEPESSAPAEEEPAAATPTTETPVATESAPSK